METFENPLEHISADPEESAEIMTLAGINPSDLDNAVTFNKVREILEFFQGKEDKRFLINKLLTGKPGVDKINHLFGYVTLRKEYNGLKDRMGTLEEEIGFYE